MGTRFNRLKHLLSRAQGMTEYAVLVGVICVMSGSVFMFKDELYGFYESMTDQVNHASVYAPYDDGVAMPTGTTHGVLGDDGRGGASPEAGAGAGSYVSDEGRIGTPAADPGDAGGTVSIPCPTVATRSSLAAYTWDELAGISNWIATGDATRTAEFTTYMNAKQKKGVEVNGVTHYVRIIGINHDIRSDGKGRAGLTFKFTDSLGTTSFATANTKRYADSTLRTQILNQKALIDDDGLREALVKVNKVCATSETETTTLQDELFCLSYIESNIGSRNTWLSHNGPSNIACHDQEGTAYEGMLNTDDALFDSAGPIPIRSINQTYISDCPFMYVDSGIVSSGSTYTVYRDDYSRAVLIQPAFAIAKLDGSGGSGAGLTRSACV